MGSYDPTIYAYAPLMYVGSNFTASKDANTTTCVQGVDNIGFVVGTSSSLFNQFYLQINSTGAPDRVKEAISGVLDQFGEQNRDVSVWPNPFFGVNSQSNPNAQEKVLTLVDGGEDLQNIPFHPLLNPAREVDVIFAIDASADTSTNWPNGTAMVATYQRSQLGTNSERFPPVPDQNTFVNLGLNQRPTFFGCNTRNTTDTNNSEVLVIYLPNTPYTYQSNVSTFDLAYNSSERNAIVRNGFDMVTMANSTLDSNWPACVACATLFKSFQRSATALPETCVRCFDVYCWIGTVNSTTPSTFEPTMISQRNSGYAIKLSATRLTLIVLFASFLQF
jgi:lysophospholipase